MATQPFFTVGVPTYNRCQVFPEAVRAILDQSFGDFELVLADNHSTDETPAVAARITDPRVKYCRHEKNLGPHGNFKFLGDTARGEFLIICQDDDLLHRDFLKRCHENVAGHPDVVMYASPWWRGNSQQGCRGHLLRDRAGLTEEYIINDRPLVLDGKTAAVSMLYAFPIAHPAIAFRTRLFQELGGYAIADDYYFDIMAEVRLLCRGKMVYDPRIGAVFHEHVGNFSHSFKSDRRLESSRLMYEFVIKELESSQVDWRRVMAEDLGGTPSGELLRLLGDWVRYRAPEAMLAIAWEKMWQNHRGSRFGVWRRIVGRLGVANTLRLVRTIKRGRA
jgi:glycosyltransferase involved in cell wall biosynthesis